MTKQKKAILDTIRQSHRHMTAEEIYEQTRRGRVTLAMATVYNNLKALVEEGKIRRIHFPGQPDYYDRNMAYHEHLICEGCKEVVDVDMEEFVPDLEKKLGVHITRYSLSLYYICPTCAALEKGGGVR